MKCFPGFHVWEIIESKESESPLEIARSNGVGLCDQISTEEILQVSRRPLIVAYKCSKCGTQKVVKG